MQVNINKINDSLIGKQWLTQGWETFKRNPLIWLAMIVSFGLIMVLLGRFRIGQYLAIAIAPLFAGGVYMTLDKDNRGESIAFADLFSVLQTQNRLQQLLILGGIGIGVTLVNAFFLQLPMGFILMFLLNIAWAIALSFSVPLVVLRKVPAIDSLMLSFKASLSNIPPLFVYFLMIMTIMVIAILPFGLGMILAIPVVFCANYTVFNALFSKDKSNQEKTLEDYRS